MIWGNPYFWKHPTRSLFFGNLATHISCSCNGPTVAPPIPGNFTRSIVLDRHTTPHRVFFFNIGFDLKKVGFFLANATQQKTLNLVASLATSSGTVGEKKLEIVWSYHLGIICYVLKRDDLFIPSSYLFYTFLVMTPLLFFLATYPGPIYQHLPLITVTNATVTFSGKEM